MANFVLIAEAVEHTEYSHEHIAWLVRKKKVAGRKIGGTWTVDLDDLKAYEEAMKAAGPKKHTPKAKT